MRNMPESKDNIGKEKIVKLFHYELAFVVRGNIRKWLDGSFVDPFNKYLLTLLNQAKFIERLLARFHGKNITKTNQEKLVEQIRKPLVEKHKSVIEAIALQWAREQGYQHEPCTTHVPANEMVELLIDTDDETFIDDSIKFFDDRFKPISNRMIYTDEKKQRRLDSLAQLLSPKSKITNCIALSVYDGEFVVAANGSSHAQAEKVADVLLQKLSFIRTFLQKYPRPIALQLKSLIEQERTLLTSWGETLSLTPEIFTKVLGEDLYQDCKVLVGQLESAGGLFQPENILVQAVIKILLSKQKAGFPMDCFTDHEYTLMFGEDIPTILIPSQNEAKQWMLEVRKHQGFEQMDIPSKLTDGKKGEDFHAEQLVAFYFQPQDQQPLMIGLPKLCCESCDEAMTKLNVCVTGRSGTPFKGVVDLFPHSPLVRSTSQETSPYHQDRTGTPSPPPISGKAFFSGGKRPGASMPFGPSCDDAVTAKPPLPYRCSPRLGASSPQLGEPLKGDFRGIELSQSPDFINHKDSSPVCSPSASDEVDERNPSPLPILELSRTAPKTIQRTLHTSDTCPSWDDAVTAKPPLPYTLESNPSIKVSYVAGAMFEAVSPGVAAPQSVVKPSSLFQPVQIQKTEDQSWTSKFNSQLLLASMVVVIATITAYVHPTYASRYNNP